MTKVAMILGHDLLEPNEDTRVYREALSLVKAGYEVTVFCWARRMDKYETKWEVERDGIKVVRIFEELEGGQNLTKLFKPYVPKNIAYASTGAIWSTADATWLMDQGADLVGVARVAIAHPDWAKGLENENYEPKPPPFTSRELEEADLSPTFIDYMRNWKGFVLD